MSSTYVQYFVRDANELHVAVDLRGHWWVVGKSGSYGGAVTRREALCIALDASATAFRGRAKIVVHRANGDVARIIRQTARRSSSQAFQDLVP